MASNINVNIKELPEVNQINDGDFLIVETPEGTSILDFANFIITQNNTTFSSILSSIDISIGSVSSSTDSVATVLNNRITSLSSTVDQKYDQLYSGKVVITIPANNSTATGALYPQPTAAVGTLETSDVILTPATITTFLSSGTGAIVTAITNSNVRGVITLSAARTVGTNTSFNAIVLKSY